MVFHTHLGQPHTPLSCIAIDQDSMWILIYCRFQLCFNENCGGFSWKSLATRMSGGFITAGKQWSTAYECEKGNCIDFQID